MCDSNDFNIFLGTATGLLKGVSFNPRAPITKTFHNLKQGLPPKDEEITCMTWDEKNILVGLKNRVVKLFDIEEKRYTNTYETNVQTDSEENYGPLKGVARLDDAVITASQSGLVKLWRDTAPDVSFNTIDVEVTNSGKLKRNEFSNEEERLKHLATLKAGRELCKMVVSPADKSIIATGGKENDLQVWNIHQPDAPVFRSKNVRPNFLELRVPVWVSDICFPDVSSSTAVAYVSRHGHIRLYDTRTDGTESRRRPVIDMEFPDETLMAVSATGNPNQVLVGSATGQMALFDFRNKKKNNGLFRKFKGSVGGIRSIYCDRDTGYFASAGLDKFVRVYNVNSKDCVNKLYLKSRLNCVLLQKNFDPTIEENDRVDAVTNDDSLPEDIKIVKDDEDLWNQMDTVGQVKRKKMLHNDKSDNLNLFSKPVINQSKKRKVKK